MAQMKDVPSSILATDGRDMNTGVLSILEKKGIRILKSSDYQLIPIYWRLVLYAGLPYLLGYTKNVPGAKVTKKLLIKGCSIEMNLPDKVVVAQNSKQTFFCIQCAVKITFLKAESKRQRNKWVDVIRNALKEPIYVPSTVSTTSTDSIESVDAHRARDHVDVRLPKSVHNTVDTAPRPGPDFRRVKTSPAGLLEMENRSSVTSIPSSAHALDQQKKRSHQPPVDMTPDFEQSATCEYSPTHSLNSKDRMRSSSQREVNYAGFYEISDQQNLPDQSETTRSHCKKSTSEPNASQQNQRYNEQEYDYAEVEDGDYTPLNFNDDDDQSSVSRVNNLGLESKTRGKNILYDDTDLPELPKRDYVNVKQKPPRPAPPLPIAPTKQPHSPDSGVLNGEPFHAYTKRFRSELFKKDGIVVEVDKTDLTPSTIKFVCVADYICIAALPSTKIHPLLHVDDVIVKVNRQTLTSINFCYKLFRTTDENKVQLHIKRVMHGVMCHVTMSANGDVDSLGLEFWNQSQGNEVTSMDCDGLVAKSGNPSRPQAQSVVNGGMLVNWSLVEINKSPVSLDSSPEEVLDQIRRSGCELVLVFIPVDIVYLFREEMCEETTDQSTSDEEGTYAKRLLFPRTQAP
ncbi:uncharacterized protein LOC135156805 [Lytechinus pictus]|uniref:uncharacterized protein LOC135156805 n=1 Tax=Lytechinus pictus TaxID=7653 RepID=UPI0030BA0EB6